MHKCKPIIFAGPMVRAILEGRKTQTRRVVKPQPEAGTDCPYHVGVGAGRRARICPYGAAGDRLWVRETFYCDHVDFPSAPINEMRELMYYRERDTAPCGETWTGFSGETMCNPWRPSIHMPRWASRLTLEIVAVRVEWLQAITEDDARAEGIMPTNDARSSFEIGWDTINGKRAPWSSNPWVWRIEFRRVEQ